MALTIQQWKDTNLLPTSGMEAWHQYEEGQSEGGVILDYSVNGRDLGAASNTPVLTNNVIDGQPAWYFDGTRDPLVWTGSVNIKQAFVVCSVDADTFADYRGLISGVTSNELLVGESGTTKFFDYTSTKYYKSGVSYGTANQQAPMGGVQALVEVQYSGGVPLDGIQVGKQKTLSRLWKGFFVEQILFSRILTPAERSRVMLYFNLKYNLFKTTEQKLYFPSDDFMNFRRRRFYAEPPMYSKITDSAEFEDGGRSFNEVADIAPRRWEYEYQLVNAVTPTDPGEVRIFDRFNERVRLSEPFYFVDKYGVEWDNVRIESYDRDHDTRKPWRQTVKFKLIRFP